MFTYTTNLHLRDTDAAGLIYFPNLFNIAQETLEAFMESVGMDIGLVLRSTHYLFPVVHAEGDFKKPMYAGQRLRITLELEQIGTTSFTLAYRVWDRGEDEELAIARVVHVVVDRQGGTKKPLPSTLMHALEQLQAT